LKGKKIIPYRNFLLQKTIRKTVCRAKNALRGKEREFVWSGYERENYFIFKQMSDVYNENVK